MFENIQAIWVEIQGDTKYLVSCIHLQTSSATTEYHEKIVDMFECATMTDHPVISLGDFNFNTLWPRQNGRRFADDAFKRIFLDEDVRISISISLNFVP